MNTKPIKSSFEFNLRSCFLLATYISIASFLLLITGCATQAPVEKPKVEQQTVWPAPPEQPRIRYVGTLRDLKNLDEEDKTSFKDVLLGKEAKANPTFTKPYAVHSDSKGRVYVGDTGVTGLLVIDTNSDKTSIWGTSGKGVLPTPVGVTSDEKGNVYVSDATDKKVVVFDHEGKFIRAFGGKDVFESPAGLVYNEVAQRLYVVDSKKHQIIVFDEQGNVDSIIGQNGNLPGYFHFPTNIAVGPKGRLYVSDTMNFRIQVLEMDGTPVMQFGQAGDRMGDFYRLKGIGVDTDGNIYAVDASYQNFQIFNQEGNLLLAVGSSGNGPGGFLLPAGASVDKNNRIFIADQLNKRIQMFQFLGD